MLKKLFMTIMAFFMFFAAVPVDAKVLPLKEDDFEYEFENDDEPDGYEILVIFNANGGKVNKHGDGYYDGVSADRTKGYQLVWVFYDETVDENDVYSEEWSVGAIPNGDYVSRTGYEFKGWYEDKKLTQEFRYRRDFCFEKKTYLYAKWAEKWKKGWRQLDDKWKYSEEKGKDYKNGIYTIGSRKYGFDKNGYMVTGWYKFDGSWYWFASSGAMATGWKKISGKWYYLGTDGKMVTGWKKISGKWYYFKSSGAMAVGWIKLSGKWYYLTSSGAMKTGWLKLDGKWYYFLSSGAMVTGSRVINGKTYNFSSSGVCLNP